MWLSLLACDGGLLLDVWRYYMTRILFLYSMEFIFVYTEAVWSKFNLFGMTWTR